MAAGAGRDSFAVCLGALTIALLLLYTLLPGPAQALVITNHASVSSDLGVSTSSVSVQAVIRTPSKIEFLQYAPGAPGATPVQAQVAAYSSDGTASGTFASTGPIVDWDSAGKTISWGTTPISLPDAVELLPASTYHAGEPIFIRLTDLDQNLDPLTQETVLISLSSRDTGDSILLRLTETGPDTGIFVGAVQSNHGPVIINDRFLSVGINEFLVVSYTDIADATDTCRGEIMIDPYGKVFRSNDGAPVSGAQVTLWDVLTDAPAEVYYDDGTPGFPATVTSGDPAYTFPPGEFRFPFVRPGTYRLVVVPPPGYSAPSTVPLAALQALPGNPFAIDENGSRGKDFVINPGPALHLDQPVDFLGGSLFISKKALKDQTAVGEFVPYSITVTNGGVASLAEVVVDDRLPPGFRYQAGSATLAGVKLAEPVVSADGRTLAFYLGNLPAAAVRELRYVAGVTVGAAPGMALNTAAARAAGNINSNQAQAQVRIIADLFSTRSLVVGRVIYGDCPAPGDTPEQEPPGLEKVKLFMEDGRYVETDPKGLYHVEGLEPGSHVIQVDLDSLPPGLEIAQCEENTRFAGVPHSTFVDLQPGTMWRADFSVRSKQPVARPQGVVDIKLTTRRQGETPAVDLKVALAGSEMRMRKRQLYVALPEGLRYQPGTARLDGQPLTDPEETKEGLLFAIGDRTPEPWQQEVSFKAEITDASLKRDYTSTAFLRYEKVRQTLAPPTPEKPAAAPPPPAPETPPAGGVATPATPAPPSTAAPDGILSLKEGQRLTSRIQGISVRFDARLKPELQVDGKLVEESRIGVQVNEKERGRKVLGYIGVDLGEPGPHRLSFRGIDPFGNARIKQEINYILTSAIGAIRVVDATGNLADGKSPVRVKLELRDQAGEVINGESLLSLKGGDLAPLGQTGETLPELRDNAVVKVDSQGFVNFAPVSSSGTHTATLAYGELTVEVRTYVKPLYREWIMVGLAEGTVGYNTLAGNMENLAAADQDDGYYQDGRLAFYAKGKVKGKYLLTAAFDSSKERDNLDNGLFGAIDPNKYYTLYGDKSRVAFDAASKDKLYLKLDGDQFYALYGDYDTGLTVTELSRYSRSLTGFKGEYYGDKLTATTFAAQTDHAFLKDELPGDGTSGLYRLSHGAILLNSEKISIETRDRFHSELVLNRRQLSRFTDYTFDAQDGTIYFREPIYSRDAAFNPIYIVAEYEVASGAARDLTAGGRVGYKLDEQGTEVGVSLVHEGTPGARADLQGVDLKYAVDDHTTIKAEAAVTDKTSGNKDLAGSAFLAEVSRHQPQLEAKAYVRQQDGEFGLGQQAGSETGTRKYGADGRYSLTKQLDLSGEIFRQETLGAFAVRDSANALLTYKQDKLTTSGGLRWARDEDGAGKVRTSTLLTGAVRRSFLADRLDLYTNAELAVAKDENTDYPNRLVLGGEYALTTTTQLLAAQELTFGDQQDTQTSRIGLKSTPWADAAFHSSLEDQSNEAGSRTFASTGLTQGWKLSDELRLDFGLERADTLRHPGSPVLNVNVPPASGAITDDFTALSTGATYKKELWSMTGRIEYRNGAQEDKAGLLWGFYREETPGFGLSSVFRYFDTERADGSRNTTGELEFSVARRPLDGQWTILDKAKFSEQRDLGQTLATRTRKAVNNLNANYLYDRRNQVSINHGIKVVIDNFDGVAYNGITQMLAVEYRHDLNKEWDLGVQSAAHVTDIGNNARYSAGASVGHSFAKNIWLSVGYNINGFRDDDFTGADYTAQGVYVKCRAKFDQNTARQLLAWWEK